MTKIFLPILLFLILYSLFWMSSIFRLFFSSSSVKKLCWKLNFVFFVWMFGKRHSFFVNNSPSVFSLFFLYVYDFPTVHCRFWSIYDDLCTKDLLSSFFYYFYSYLFISFFSQIYNKSSPNTIDSIFFLFSSSSLSSLADSYYYPPFFASAYFIFSCSMIFFVSCTSLMTVKKIN